ncbi:MAG: putative rRNA methyltransferase [Frondihabitans sp.]|nr:putative rRNA methyltransferase [Frondihabitans sp.]
MIDNPRSPRVRAVAKLAKRDARSQTGLFLLEGPQAVTEALSFRPELVVELFATPTALERYTELAQAAVDAGVDIEFVTEDVLSAMADTVTPQGLVAVCRQFPTSVKDIFGGGDDAPTLVAILEEVRDPGNAGTIIRAADAAGADAVIMTGRSVDLYNPKVVRATTGSLFHVPVAVGVDLEGVLRRCAESGLQVLAADVKGGDLLEVRNEGILAEPTAWLFGNEARGLTDENLALADRAVVVPIYGHAESMNLATAASVCLYESAFAQH